jgi:hypothetical protein
MRSGYSWRAALDIYRRVENLKHDDCRSPIYRNATSKLGIRQSCPITKIRNILTNFFLIFSSQVVVYWLDELLPRKFV